MLKSMKRNKKCFDLVELELDSKKMRSSNQLHDFSNPEEDCLLVCAESFSQIDLLENTSDRTDRSDSVESEEASDRLYNNHGKSSRSNHQSSGNLALGLGGSSKRSANTSKGSFSSFEDFHVSLPTTANSTPMSSSSKRPMLKKSFSTNSKLDTVEFDFSFLPESVASSYESTSVKDPDHGRFAPLMRRDIVYEKRANPPPPIMMMPQQTSTGKMPSDDDQTSIFDAPFTFPFNSFNFQPSDNSHHNNMNATFKSVAGTPSSQSFALSLENDRFFLDVSTASSYPTESAVLSTSMLGKDSLVTVEVKASSRTTSRDRTTSFGVGVAYSFTEDAIFL